MEDCRVSSLGKSDFLHTALTHSVWVDKFATDFVGKVLKEALVLACNYSWSIECSQECHSNHWKMAPGDADKMMLRWTPEYYNSPKRRNSFKSRLSLSHGSLTLGTLTDDSDFISGALSHDHLYGGIYSKPDKSSGELRRKRSNSESLLSGKMLSNTSEEPKSEQSLTHSATEPTSLDNDASQNKKTHKSSYFFGFFKSKTWKKEPGYETRNCDGKKNKSFHKTLPLALKQTFNSILRPSKSSRRKMQSIMGRALPPLPPRQEQQMLDEYLWDGKEFAVMPDSIAEELATRSPPRSTHVTDFFSSIERVKDYGWYWGPISSSKAEHILQNEPEGSFMVRDSSDVRYIFSLTFKLNGGVRHVRIEHDHGNFSFGSFSKFRSQTIVDFIESAVEHSRSGRYLFFLHRRPALGPMRVQLLNPVSRFKHVQTLQHLCRFVIMKHVRKDLIGWLPLPKRLLDYLNTPQYYTEQI